MLDDEDIATGDGGADGGPRATAVPTAARSPDPRVRPTAARARATAVPTAARARATAVPTARRSPDQRVPPTAAPERVLPHT